MNDEAARLLAFAAKKLSHAEKILGLELWEPAGREAYHAALAAARAMIVHSGGRPPKTHNGARKVFSDLIRQGLPFDSQLAKFLASGYEIKSAADYADGAPVDEADAKEAIATARTFLASAKKICG